MRKLFILFIFVLFNFLFAVNPKDISSLEYSLDDSNIAISAVGKACVVWMNYHRYNHTSKLEYATSKDFGNSWEKAQMLINADDGYRFEEPKIIMNNSDGIICTWNNKSESDFTVETIEMAISSDFGKHWKFSKFNADKYSLVNEDNVVFVVLAKDNPDHTWNDDYRYLIEIRKSNDFGLTWEESKFIKTKSYTHPIIKLNNSGKVLLVWEDSSYENYKTKYFLKTSFSNDFGKSWSDPSEIQISIDPDKKDAFFDEDGNTTIIWERALLDDFGYTSHIFYSYSSNFGKSWSDEMILNKQESSLYNNEFNISSNSQRLFIVWPSEMNSNEFGYQIKYSYSDDFGKTWSLPNIISEKNMDCRSTEAYSDANGNVLIIWHSYSLFNDSSITNCRFSSDFGKNWFPIVDLSNIGYGFKDPKLVVWKNGKVIVLWNQKEGIKERYQIALSDDFGKTWK